MQSGVKVKQFFRQFKSPKHSVDVSNIVQAIHTCDSKVTRYYGIMVDFSQKKLLPLPDLWVHDHSPQFSALPIVSYWAPRMRNQRFGLLLQYLESWFPKEKRPSIFSVYFWFLGTFESCLLRTESQWDSQSTRPKATIQPTEGANGMSIAMLFWPVENLNQTVS